VPWSTTIPDALVTVNTNNNLLLVHARARVQPRSGRWRPYVDGLFGFKYIYTKTSIDLGSSCSGSICSSVGVDTTNLDDLGLSYGGGGGVMIGLGSAPRRAKLDLSLRYIAGSESDYLREGAIRRESGQAILDVSHSRTDIVVLYVGIAWESR
jgi:hypothetical protein